MMMGLLVFREKVKGFYAKYDVYVSAVLKFILAFLVFFFANLNTGYVVALKTPFLSIGLAILCSFLPLSAITVFMGILLIVQLSAVSVELGIMLAIIVILMMLVYFVFRPGNSILLAVTVLICALQGNGVLAIVVGLAFGPLAIVPVAFGMLISSLLQIVKSNYNLLAATGSDGLSAIDRLHYCIESMLKDEKTWLLLIAALITILVVYTIRRRSLVYAWGIAIAAGAVTYIVTILFGMFWLRINMNLTVAILSVLVGVLISLVLTLFVFTVDYARTEYVQFEDDEYVYYVKAIPKISIAAPQMQIRSITDEDGEEAEDTKQ